MQGRQQVMLLSVVAALLALMAFIYFSREWGDRSHPAATPGATSSATTVDQSRRESRTSHVDSRPRPDSASATVTVIDAKDVATTAARDWRLLRTDLDLTKLLDALETTSDLDFRATIIHIHAVCLSVSFLDDNLLDSRISATVDKNAGETAIQPTRIRDELNSSRSALKKFCNPINDPAVQVRVERLGARVRAETSVTKDSLLPGSIATTPMTSAQKSSVAQALADPQHYAFAIDSLLRKLADSPGMSALAPLTLDQRRYVAASLYGDLTGDRADDSFRTHFLCANYGMCPSVMRAMDSLPDDMRIHRIRRSMYESLSSGNMQALGL